MHYAFTQGVAKPNASLVNEKEALAGSKGW
jgi:hypothetical protein